MTDNLRLLRRPEVESKTGMCRSTIYEQVARGEFPAPIKLGRRASAWLEADIERWIADRIAASRGGAKV
jgi:prophage regulatory protein